MTDSYLTELFHVVSCSQYLSVSVCFLQLVSY